MSASHTDETVRFGNLFAPKIIIFGQIVLTVTQILRAMKKQNNFTNKYYL